MKFLLHILVILLLPFSAYSAAVQDESHINPNLGCDRYEDKDVEFRELELFLERVTAEDLDELFLERVTAEDLDEFLQNEKPKIQEKNVRDDRKARLQKKYNKKNYNKKYYETHYETLKKNHKENPILEQQFKERRRRSFKTYQKKITGLRKNDLNLDQRLKEKNRKQAKKTRENMKKKEQEKKAYSEKLEETNQVLLEEIWRLSQEKEHLMQLLRNTYQENT